MRVYDLKLGKLAQDGQASAKLKAIKGKTVLERVNKACMDPLLKRCVRIELMPMVEIEFK